MAVQTKQVKNWPTSAKKKDTTHQRFENNQLPDNIVKLLIYNIKYLFFSI